MLIIPRSHTPAIRRGCAAFAVVLIASCSKKEPEQEQGVAPPPVESSKPGACASGGGTVKDTVASKFFPRTAASYCIDPNGETRSYGKEATGTLDTVCTEQFDGECEVYKSFGLNRVVTLRYIDGQGSPGSVNVNLSRFDSPEGAYGFFTKRVVADADPLENAPKPLEAGGAGAIGTGVAYVWRADYVAELSYANELEAPEQLAASSAKVLPPLAKSLGDGLPGAVALLPAVQKLPSAERIPMGISYAASDLLNVAGAGHGAMGFYQSGAKRYRVIALVRPDDAAAEDVYKTLRKIDGAKGLKTLPFEAVAFDQQSGEDTPKVSWVVGRKGNTLLGVGDEEFVATGGADGAGKLLDKTEKEEKLKQLFETAGASPEQK